ncbi:MAG: hypothetical protein AAF633_29065, partial [Chloroflexota bacterium]
GNWSWYMLSIPRGKVPVRPVGSIILQGSGVVIGLVALLRLDWRSILSTIPVLFLTGFAVGMAGFFFWLLSQRKTPLGKIQIAVGDQLLPFEAVTSEGQAFQSAQFEGKRILLKFFRGGW